VIESVEVCEIPTSEPVMEGPVMDSMEYAYSEEHPEISLHAITGSSHPKTMRIIGTIGGKRVIILIDSGSTHNFLDSSVVQSSRLLVSKESRVRVQVANGEQILSEGKCAAVAVEVQKFRFHTDFFVIILAGCDVVLGIQWLVSLGSILWNFKDLTMEFTIAMEMIRLQGLASPTMLVDIQNSAQDNALQKSILLQLLDAEGPNAAQPFCGAVQQMLGEFSDVFAKPTGFPPSRSHDHAILLKPNTQPICVRPYRYPFYRKEEIEKIVRELLTSWVIKPSQSPFSSPVLLVRKADGSWRMCMDYRALNNETVKDKFPIPVIDELLDELHGSKIYSKLDLRSGYH
jgi:hypothetical protein